MAWRARGRWVWYALPRGLVVAMRASPDAPGLQLRLARAQAPERPEAFDQEVAVLLRHFGGVAAWAPLEVTSPPPAGIVRLFAAQAPTTPQCARCGAAVQDPGLYREDLCTPCATALGQHDTNGRVRR
jgi:non-ribosomal peptide synthetase component F